LDGSERLELVRWLESMARMESDLGPAMGERRRARRLGSTAHVVLEGEYRRSTTAADQPPTAGGAPAVVDDPASTGVNGAVDPPTDRADAAWGYAELHRLGRSIELAAVVIDPAMRGSGHSHDLVAAAITRWHQDTVLHRATAPVTAAVRLPLICFTRARGLARSLETAGFQHQPARRHASRLWLWRSSVAGLPASTQAALFLDRGRRSLRMLFTDPRRMLHQMGRLSVYQTYLLPADATSQRRPAESPIDSYAAAE